MKTPRPHRYPQPASKDTATSSQAFVETIEYSRFVEFFAMHVAISATLAVLWTAWYR
jgi:hypothetical protein